MKTSNVHYWMENKKKRELVTCALHKDGREIIGLQRSTAYSVSHNIAYYIQSIRK